MINKNFNSISQFSVPQEWIDGALCVPQNEKRKKPVIFVKFSRTFAAVASLVIVCSISLLLFFLTEENAVPPIREPESTSSVTDVENNSDATTYPDVIRPTLESSETLPNGETSSSPSQDSTSTKPSKPTIGPTEKPSDGPPLPTEPSEQLPTHAPDVPTEEPTDVPTSRPTAVPTDAPTDAPTENPTPPPWEPTEEPTDEPTDAPTDEPTEPIDFDSIGIHRRVDTTQLTGTQKVYCKLYNPYGSLMGDSNLFASSHLAIKSSTDSSITIVHYYPYRNMDITLSGSYTFVFYNESGEELTRGSIYLQANSK